MNFPQMFCLKLIPFHYLQSSDNLLHSSNANFFQARVCNILFTTLILSAFNQWQKETPLFSLLYLYSPKLHFTSLCLVLTKFFSCHWICCFYNGQTSFAPKNQFLKSFCPLECRKCLFYLELLILCFGGWERDVAQECPCFKKINTASSLRIHEKDHHLMLASLFAASQVFH